jgi:hypothetical protein
LLLIALAVLLLFVLQQSVSLWREWAALQGDWALSHRNPVVGFRDINPHFSSAEKPANWIHDEGMDTLLWAGWSEQGGHRWFRVGRGDVEKDRVAVPEPFGRDTIRAIDFPLVETGGGPVWEQIPREAPVVGLQLAGVLSVYPVKLLDRVEVINDLLGEQPVLIVFNPLTGLDRSVDVYEPVVDGHRVTMGLAGYFHDRKPMLYDRGTESLWVSQDEALQAIAGRHKGARLRRIDHPIPVSWGQWRAHHPASRLLIGADRSHALPAY